MITRIIDINYTKKSIKMRNTIVLVALFAGAIIAAPTSTLKKSLGQMSAKNLAQTEGGDWSMGDWTGSGFENCTVPDLSGVIDNATLLECPCNFSQLPGLGGAQSQGFEQRGEVT
jgi:hypothetical protein